MKLSKRKLEDCLSKLAHANSEAYIQRNILSDHCMKVYGCDPADVDNDEFIDLNDGGAGSATAMTTEQFHQSMLDAIEISNFELDKE